MPKYRRESLLPLPEILQVVHAVEYGEDDIEFLVDFEVVHAGNKQVGPRNFLPREFNVSLLNVYAVQLVFLRKGRQDVAVSGSKLKNGSGVGSIFPHVVQHGSSATPRPRLRCECIVEFSKMLLSHI